MTEQELVERLTRNPDDIDAALQLAELILNDGRAVPVELEEQVLRHHLSRAPSRNDLSARLSAILMEQGRAIPAELEERAIRHHLALDPTRLDLYDRFASVALQNLAANSHEAAIERDPREVVSLVARARERLADNDRRPAAADLPPYGKRWGEYVRRMRGSIETLDTPTDVLRYAQTRVGFEHRCAVGKALQHFAQYERELSAEFPQFAAFIPAFDDPPGSAPATQLVLGGRRVSNMVPYLSRILMSCFATMPAPRTVLELGGGYGAAARLWLTNPISPAATCIVADIPESLFFADVFLSREFGADAVAYVGEDGPASVDLLRRHRVILCPVTRLRSIEHWPVDLILNTGSFQEMPDEWVSHYMRWLDRQGARFFYSLNYFAQPLNYLAESVNLWSPRPSSAWRAKVLRWNPALVRMQTDRNYLEAIYEREGAAPPSPSFVEGCMAALADRAMNGSILAEYMEIFRRSLEPDVALVTLRRMMTEMPFHPKEALWLAQWLKKEGGAAVQREMSAIDAQLESLLDERKSGVEGTT